jgi:hypothetical protein
LGLPDEANSVQKEKPSDAEHAANAATPEVQPQEEEKRTRPSEVGFGRPPVQSRFRKGQSGNPAGRPPTAETFARIIKRLLLEKARITENGHARTVTKAASSLRADREPDGPLDDPRFLKLLLEYIPSVDIVLVRDLKPPKKLDQRIRKALSESMNSDD